MKSRDIVLLHGGNHGSWCWDALIESMRRAGYEGRLIALDVPGCGSKRGRDGSGLSLDDVAKELNEDVRRQLVSGALLVGHSMAGILLPRMVALDGDLYEQACFLATCIPVEGESVVDTLGYGVQGSDPARVGWVVAPGASRETLFEAMFSPDMDRATVKWLVSNCLQDNWPPTAATEPVSRAGFPGNTRVSYIVTQRDPALPPAWQGRFAERVGADRLYQLDTPHEPFITHPEQLGSLLMSITD